MMQEKENIKITENEIVDQTNYINKVCRMNEGKLFKYHISTFGCQMNEHESEKLAGMLKEMGYEESQKKEESHFIILNTCCVRENAEEKVFGHLGALKKLKRDNPEKIIAICGCMTQQKDVVEQIKNKYRHVDIVFGTHNLYKLPKLLYETLKYSRNVIDVMEIDGYVVEDIPIVRKDDIKALVNITYGCNNFCSYCIVPYVRGRERSRKPEDIIKEVELLGESGHKEITLLGQNVNSYGNDLHEGISFANLLVSLNQIKGIERIRFMTSHPKDLSDDLIEAISKCEKVCKHLHLPVQSGSTKVLADMNRKYSKEQYLSLVQKVKSRIPYISLTTDIIVGFPGETDEDFEDTLDVVKNVRFDMAYTFLYSKRTGTPAAKRADQIQEDVKKNRFNKLLELQNEVSIQINNKLLGTEVQVLVEGVSKNNSDVYTGRTETNKVVNFKGNESFIGKIVTVRIEKVQTWSLEGNII